MSDFTEIGALVADLTDAPAKALPYVKSAVQYTAQEIKSDWQIGAAVGGDVRDNFAVAYADSIDYDMKYPGDAIEAEIGPNRARKGGSAGFLEDAPGGVDSPPQHAGRDALEANEDDFVRGLEIAIFDATAEAIEKG